jgi:hypothetical protein
MMNPDLPTLPEEQQLEFVSKMSSAMLGAMGETMREYLQFNIPVHLLQGAIGHVLTCTFEMLPASYKTDHLDNFKTTLDGRVASQLKRSMQ